MELDQQYQDATVVPADAVALVVSADGQVQIALPKDEFELNDAQIALAQLAVRFMNDPEWVAELAAELQHSAN